MNLDKRIEEGIKKLIRRAEAAKRKENKDLEAGEFGRRQAARAETEKPLNQRIAQNVKDADARAKAGGRSATGTTQAIVRSKNLPSSTTTKLQVGMKGDAGKLGNRAIAAKRRRARRKWREKEYGKENASTQYEGPSLSEQLEFIKTFLSEDEKTGAKKPEPKKPKPKWPFPPTKEAVDRLKKIIADREATQVESRSIEDQHAEYERLALKAGRTPGKPHPMHGEHFPEDPPKENLTPAQQKRRNKQIKRSKLF